MNEDKMIAMLSSLDDDPAEQVDRSSYGRSGMRYGIDKQKSPAKTRKT